MAISNPFRRLKASTSSLDDLSSELGRLDRIRLDAQNLLHDLGARRPALLVDGTDKELATLDAEMAAARRALEQAEARTALIEPEWRQADVREAETKDAAARAERHAAAVKARAEGVKLLAAYEADAKSLAAKLSRLQEIERQIAVTNDDLPEEAAPIGGIEPFNGRHGTPDSRPSRAFWVTEGGGNYGPANPGDEPPVIGAVRRFMTGYSAIPGLPGVSHLALFDRVALPRLDPHASPFWLGDQAAGPRLTGDQVAILRFHGVHQ